MKQCYKCQLTKPLDDFYKDKSRKDGHWNQCKDCYRNKTKGPIQRKHILSSININNDTGICSICGDVALHWRRKRGELVYGCKNAYLESKRKYREKHQEKAKVKIKIPKGQRYSKRRSKLQISKTHHGLTQKERKEFIKGKVCAICGSSDRLAVDHCHENLFIRDVLCQRCNHGLGFFHDNVDLMHEAIKYLEKHKARYESGLVEPSGREES
jgi:hypothetical protein